MSETRLPSVIVLVLVSVYYDPLVVRREYKEGRGIIENHHVLVLRIESYMVRTRHYFLPVMNKDKVNKVLSQSV